MQFAVISSGQLMMQLNLPDFDFKLDKTGGKTTIFDPLRKKYIFLTPEEWVRQHFVNYLTMHLYYPKSLIKLEGGLIYNKMQRRSDVVVFTRQGSPFMIIECKAPAVKITQKVFDQAAAYNATIRAKYLVVTNGLQHFCCHIDQEKASFSFISDIPPFDTVG